MNDNSKTSKKNHYKIVDEVIAAWSDSINVVSIKKCCAKVNVFLSDSKEIKIQFHGQIKTDGELEFGVKSKNNSLNIILSVSGNIRNNELVLDIAIPKSKKLQGLYIESLKDITISNDIFAETLDVKSKFGSINTQAAFQTASISCPDGNIDINADAKQNIILAVSTQFGKISLKLANIANINFTNLDDFHQSLKRFHDFYRRIPGGYVADLSYKLGCGSMEISNC